MRTADNRSAISGLRCPFRNKEEDQMVSAGDFKMVLHWKLMEPYIRFWSSSMLNQVREQLLSAQS